MSSSSSRGAPDVPVQPRGDPPAGWPGWLGQVRRFSLAALPLALAGLLPWWCVLLLCVLFAASAVSAAWRDGRLLVSVMLVGVAIVPGVLEAVRSGVAGWNLFLTLQNTYFAGMFGVLLLHWAASSLANGNRVALLVVAGVGLLAPQPGLVLALAGGALSREGPDDRATPFAFSSGNVGSARQRYAGWVTAGLLLLMAVAFVLPRQAALAPAETSVPVSQYSTERADAPARPAGNPIIAPPNDSEPGEPQIRFSLGAGQHILVPPMEWSLVMGTLMLLALTYRLWQYRGGERRRLSLLEILLGVALLWNLVMFMFMSQSPDQGGVAALPPTPTGETAEGKPGQTEFIRRAVPFVMDLMSVLVWLALIFQAVLLVVVIVWALQGKRQAAVTAPGQPVTEPLTDGAGVATGHRVRLAYREAQEALAGHGWARLNGETPARYAARLSGAKPEFSAALTLLTTLYEPVRYGGRVTEQDAGRAEQAARELTQLAALHPFIDPDEENQELA